MGKSLNKFTNALVRVGTFGQVGADSVFSEPPKIDTSSQDALLKAQQDELKLEEERKKTSQNKAFAEAEAIKKGFRSKGQGLSVLGESENQLLG